MGPLLYDPRHMARSSDAPGEAEPFRGDHERYELGERLAQGGMGVIYAAHDRVAMREVVYKQLLLDDPESRASRTVLFRREYDALARLPHPNIVEVYDYGEASGTPYYVMEHLGGADLAHAAPLPPQEACRIARDVASALALIHTRRLVHRDVSPNNVRLTHDGTAKLIDFGALTPFGCPEQLVGTPGFIAPESFSHASLDQRSDLYALGALLYWALTCRTPYGPLSLAELQEAVAEPPLPPSAYVDIPPELDRLVLALLSKDPHGRPTDASYVIERLTSIALLPPEADEPRVARSYLAHPPLSGRRAAIDAMRAAIEEARNARGRVVLIEGEAGLGRSAALAAAAQHAQLEGMLVLRARGDGSGESFRTARSLLDAARALRPDLAARAIPSVLSERRKTETAVGQAGRHAALVDAACTTLLALSAHCPLVLVVDDLHLADEPSRALLAALALDVHEQRMTLLISSLRDAATRDSPDDVLLASVAKRIFLGLLDKAEVGTLVRALFGDVPNALKVAHWLHEQSGGHPATTLDLLRLAMERRLIRYTLGTFTLPFDLGQEIGHDALDDLVFSRLGGLHSKLAKVAVALSLHRDWLIPEELSAAIGWSTRDVQLALDELVTRGVVARSERGYQFLGSTLRDALLRSIPEEDRRALHAGLAGALLRSAVREPSLVYDAALHLLRAGNDEAALKLLVGRAHSDLDIQEAIAHAELLELAVASALRRGRPKEQCLSLLLPLARTGFHGNAQRHAAYIDTTLTWMSDVCGMTLAKRLTRLVGPRLALVFGLTYAALRRLFRSKRDRLGTLSYMLASFVLLACDSTALACAACDARACRRFTAWLDPLAVLPKKTAGWILREFCLATCELAAGQPDRCAARYQQLVPRLLEPIEGMEEFARKSVYLGTINGRGLAEAALGDKVALELADKLDADAFYASFAEGIRFEYHAVRGDRETAAACRARAEQLALHGGISWTASSSLAQVTAFAATLTEDAIALVHVCSEFDRLAVLAPALRAYKRICEGWLEHMRGHSERALALFEEVIDTDEADGLIFALMNRTLYAAVLNALGLHERAQAVCEAMAQGARHRGERSLTMRGTMRQLAIAHAGQGRIDQARALAAQQLIEALPLDNPLELGACHRDQARIALIAGDKAAFDVHFGEMDRCFGRTRNPSLRRQCDTLLAEAERRGLRVPVSRTSRRPPQALDEETFVEVTRKK